METATLANVAPKRTPLTQTTRRGFATASLSFGLWGSLVFWWYPFGFMIASLGVTFAIISLLMGFRVGGKGENLAWLGLMFGSIGAGSALTAYRFMQIAFEGAPSSNIPYPMPW